ncbi:beta-ketoacyl synthase N-terminal-like domain-containing protein [Lentzea flava]|uniref:Polyketide beta-ketoacyl:ACP synthase n=1 Tax=Lentzea flava TaxID=103732 RepID=A0ABQ2UGH2_9PSEU|nr:beta-ketoacyl synthase N-terminal-like domain-containing protein [Lentzea flava]MCP2199001.1 malonyl-ACP decarboxylase [Lentzea flava]GGU32362.1 polyketide beta-ketoacyl:ACP synthase [Lentzea flava]
MTPERVFITSAAVLCTVAEDLDAFRSALLEGRSGVADADGARLSFDLGDWAGRHLDEVTGRRLKQVAHRAALPAQTAACVALKTARRLGERAGLIVAGGQPLGHQADTVLRHRDKPGALRASYALTHLDVDVVGVVSELTGIRGEGWALGGGSAGGTLAVIQAARMITAGWLDQVLVVAPLAELSAAEFEAFRRTGAMISGDATCRPFDEERSGFVYGQAAAAIVLERESIARTPLAEIAGHGHCLDARRGTEPDSDGQVRAMRAALGQADPAEVDYVNAHGTGSVLGDETEARSIGTVFGASTPLVNSTKPLVGHCLSAAGLVELVATVVQLGANAVHPNPTLGRPIDGIRLAGRTAAHQSVRTALSNSFAFGGINASVLVRAA